MSDVEDMGYVPSHDDLIEDGFVVDPNGNYVPICTQCVCCMVGKDVPCPDDNVGNIVTGGVVYSRQKCENYLQPTEDDLGGGIYSS